VVFADETKIRLFDSKVGGNVYVRCKKEDRLKPDNIIPVVKFGGDGINFWGCFSAHGMGILKKIDGTLTGEKYSKIIENELI